MAPWLPHPDPALYHRAVPPPDAQVLVRFLGTAGFVITARQRTIVVDPYVSRPGLLRTLFGRLRPDAERIRGVIPRADDVLVGHAHYDHVLDAPELCRQTGARLVGSPAVAHVGRAAGLPPEQIVETRGREDVVSGPMTVRGLPSLHGRVYFGRVTLPGDITAPPPWPPRAFHLRHGLVLNWLVDTGVGKVVHIDSADFLEHELQGHTCDVLCLCAIGRAWRDRYVLDAVRILKPKYVIPCHWDLFTTPYQEDPVLLPGVDLAGMVEEIRAAGAEPIVLPFEGVFGF
jgi:L-ascorbate metabolism protein UlaG (beta-lactamase superfamily)